MLITPAYAQTAATDPNGMLMSLLPFALIFVIMYFLILRPQQRKVKDHAELVKNLRRGDTVVTSGGLVGKVTKVVDDDQVEVEISDGVRVKQMRQMISGVRAKGEPAKDTKADKAEAKADAKAEAKAEAKVESKTIEAKVVELPKVEPSKVEPPKDGTSGS